MKDAYKLVVVDNDSVEFYGDSSRDLRHSEYLIQYMKEKCSDIELFDKLNDKIIPEQLSCFLVYVANKAIVLNETKYDEQGICKYGSTACVILPSEVDGNMLGNLLALELDKFSNVIIERVQLSSDKILEDIMVLDYDDLPVNDRLIAIASKINEESRRFSK